MMRTTNHTLTTRFCRNRTVPSTAAAAAAKQAHVRPASPAWCQCGTRLRCASQRAEANALRARGVW